MTEGIWDEKPPIMAQPEGSTVWLCNPKFLDWLEKLKAYYDVTTNSIQVYEWKEKAEKYDEIQDCVPFVRHLAFEQVVKEYKTMQDKLEAIKTHRENFRHSSYIEWLRELDKILKGEDLQSIGESPT